LCYDSHMPRRSIFSATPAGTDPALHLPEERASVLDPEKEAPNKAEDILSALANTDLSEFFSSTGPLAQVLEGYELRHSQLQMAEAVKRAILSRRHALIEAPTGTGKSIAYLIPAILSGKTVVVSTANKSLQSQLFQKEIPFLRKVLNRPISAVIVKGRSNFICTLKWEKESREQRYISLYDRADEQFQFLQRWLDETESGDIDELPFVLNNDLRMRVVSFPDDCLHNDCRHYDDNCWVNRMRDEAAQAQVIITNHHLLLNALELGYAGERILPPASIYVIDEAHHLEQIATAVFERMVTDYTVEQLLSRTIFKEHIGDDEIERLRYLNTLAFQEISQRSRENSFELTGDLEGALSLSAALTELGQRLKRANPYAAAVEQAAKQGERPDPETAERHRSYELTVTALQSAAENLKAIGSSRKDGAVVRYAVRIFDRRHVTLEVHAAPINPADLLSAYLFHPEDEDSELVDRTVICTSATLATAGGFHHYKARCGIRSVGEELVLPAVFDYPRQALLYQPALPAYDYRNADAYYDAVAAEIERLLEVSRGRALCLFTSWSGLQQVSDRLQAGRSGATWPLRAQGDAPREALLSWFKATPYSVLLATRSFWEGVDIPGEELSLVVLDKLPFPTPGDPLHAARMRAIDEQGRSSFEEYMIPLMTLALKQGFGRLIRRSDDCGVVAILDERLTSKAYGRRSRQDLPPARFTREFRDVHRFYSQALGSPAEFALNVWPDSDAPQSWRWRLVRLSDGRAEMHSVRADVSTPEHAEIHAALNGLQDLQRRIRRAGQESSRYAVELRCSRKAAQWLTEAPDQDELFKRWVHAVSAWQAVLLRAVRE
jgi:ATP-dependent DNA helicase DinG